MIHRSGDILTTVEERSNTGSGPVVTLHESTQIMSRIANGDRGEFDAFVRRFGPFVVGRALRISRDPAAADDIAQVVLANVWLKAASFNAGRGNLLAWLQILTRNAAIDYLRVEGRHSRNSETLIREARRVDFSVSDAAERRQDRQIVRQALAQLGEDQRNAIELAYFHGLTYVEVAERIGEPEGTVKSRIRRGLAQLARLVGEIDE